MTSEHKGNNISHLRAFGRGVVSMATSPVLRHEVVEKSVGGLDRARSFIYQGLGMVVAYTHFSKRDDADVMQYLITDPVFRTRTIVSPIAFHQYRGWIGALANAANIELHPIVTKDTLQHEKFGHVTINDGIDRYIQRSVGTLRLGGIVPIAVQGGRRPTLGEPTRALSMFMAQTMRKHVDQYGILFVGLELPGQEDYSTVRGYIPGRKILLNIGDAFTASEVFDQAINLRGIDTWAFSQFKTLVPPSYLIPSI